MRRPVRKLWSSLWFQMMKVWIGMEEKVRFWIYYEGRAINKCTFLLK